MYIGASPSGTAGGIKITQQDLLMPNSGFATKGVSNEEICPVCVFVLRGVHFLRHLGFNLVSTLDQVSPICRTQWRYCLSLQLALSLLKDHYTHIAYMQRGGFLFKGRRFHFFIEGTQHYDQIPELTNLF